MSSIRRLVLLTAIAALILPLTGASSSALATGDAPVADPVPDRPVASGIQVTLAPYVTIPASNPTTPTARINYLGEVPDGSGRRYVPDLNGVLWLVDDGEPVRYLDPASLLPRFVRSPGLGSGLGFVAFHPDFANNGRFYTVHTEDGMAADVPRPSLPSPSTSPLHGVVTEWRAEDPAAATFSGTRRELLRIGFRTPNHGIQQIGFDPTVSVNDPDHGLLYLGVGDGETPSTWTDAPQRLDSPRGKILRIDPTGSNSGNGRYGIPADNPFAGRHGALPEVFALGLRNPHRFSWDPLDGRMLLGNIGEKRVESIYDVRAGDNFGWNVREGAFAFRREDPTQVYPLPADDHASGFTYPVASFDNPADGVAIVGGFVYRGSEVPELHGRYVFSDVARGRLYYTDADRMSRGGHAAPLHELEIVTPTGVVTDMRQLAGQERVDLRLGQDASGELYVLAKANGRIWRIVDAERVGACGSPDTTVAEVMGRGDWEPVTPTRWRFPGSEVVLAEPGTARPGPRRPFEYALVDAGPTYRSVVIDAEVRLDTPVSGRGEDVVLVVAHQADTRFYYVHLADVTNGTHNGIFAVVDAHRRRIDQHWDGQSGIAPALTDNDWHRIRVVHCSPTGRLEVYLDDMLRPAMTANDTRLDGGRVGFGSFDNTGRIRNLRVNGERRTGRIMSCPAGTGSGFVDVPASSPHAAGTRCADALGLFVGGNDGRFRPDGTLTRAQAATVIDRLATGTGHPIRGARRTFPDVSSTDVHRDAIERLAGAGVLGGFDDGTFRPRTRITRAQLAALLVRLAEEAGGQSLPRGERFVDVPAGSTHDDVLRKARRAGIFLGDEHGRAFPSTDLRRDQAASLVTRSLSTLPAP
ncbi:PQQ-dependent sugar dehydrogenase [Egicoccus sp. AB-alg2]|uniref:PQQ-dependent sugar dehydrogenase n=1 Tax=Egicoccus sp. AB-alg2 TaxID=3242693 RepID=UPI00359D6C94